MFSEITCKVKEVFDRSSEGQQLSGFVTRPYAANVHKGTASVSVAGLSFRVRACDAWCR